MGYGLLNQAGNNPDWGDVSDYSYSEALERAMKTTKYIEAGDPKSALTIHDVFKQYQLKKAANQ